MSPFFQSLMALICLAASVSAAGTYLIAHELYLAGQRRAGGGSGCLTVPLSEDLVSGSSDR